MIDTFLCKLTKGTIETTTCILTKKFCDHQPYFIKIKYVHHKEHKPKYIKVTEQDTETLNIVYNQVNASPLANAGLNIDINTYCDIC